MLISLSPKYLLIWFFYHSSEVHEQALYSCDAVHRERRILLKQEIGRMVLFFTDQPSLLAPNIQVCTCVDLFMPLDLFANTCWVVKGFVKTGYKKSP